MTTMADTYKRLWDNDFIALKKKVDDETFRRMSPFITTADIVIKAAEDGDTARRQARIYVSRAGDEADLPFVFVAVHLWLLGVEDSKVVPALATAEELLDWRGGKNLPAPSVRRQLYDLCERTWQDAHGESVCSV